MIGFVGWHVVIISEDKIGQRSSGTRISLSNRHLEEKRISLCSVTTNNSTFLLFYDYEKLLWTVIFNNSKTNMHIMDMNHNAYCSTLWVLPGNVIMYLLHRYLVPHL